MAGARCEGGEEQLSDHDMVLSSGSCQDSPGLGLEAFRHAAQEYYSSGRFTMDQVAQLTAVWQDFESVKEQCAPAVLQAQLLKAEERALLGGVEMDRFMLRYTELLHEALRLHRLVPVDFHRWPLDTGLARVRQVREAFEEPSVPPASGEPREGSAARRPLADMVMNFCSRRDRNGVEHALGWLGQEPLRSLLRSASVRVVLYLVDRPHCDTSSEQFASLEEAVGRLMLVRYRGARRREEQSAYFKYLAEHYDDMPEYVIFVHPDAPEHQGEDFAALRRALALMRSGSQLARKALQYYPLSLQLIARPARTRKTSAEMDGLAQDWPEFWHRVFGTLDNAICPSGCPWNAEMTETFQIYVASQAIVGRDRILLHPRSYYASFARDAEWCGNNSGNLEAVWHVLFGEPLRLLPREEDPKLPLALKWGVPTIRSDGALGVI